MIISFICGVQNPTLFKLLREIVRLFYVRCFSTSVVWIVIRTYHKDYILYCSSNPILDPVCIDQQAALRMWFKHGERPINENG